jgi:uncharacterized circularly permuted ATP-grasp superfamily protein/uncharacterized alpha-E superfamily protein
VPALADAASIDAGLAALTAGYRARPDTPDEMMDAAGEMRPHWRSFLRQLLQLGPSERDSRFAAANRHLRDAGVFYRVYEGLGGGERPWPLSHMPVLIEAEEWRALSAGLAQRAAIMEAVLADAFGAGDLVRAGVVPAAVFAGSPEFLRPLVGIKPRGGRWLTQYAVDLGRGPDGRWWVLSDRAQAPSGSGYALENRMALSRALPELYRSLRVERLAGFFQAYRATLAGQTAQSSARVCLLTPGPMNETYFEHAFLARYLGFLLVEGSDLAVENDAVFVRTVQGRVPASVIVRRLDADFCDPLAFNVRSRIGVPGLLKAVEAGQVTLANALGSGLVESRALLAFLPALARHLTGQDLAIPSVATWWCGQERERATTLARLDELVIAPAVDGTATDVLPHGPVLGAALAPAQRQRLLAAMQHRGMDFVGQEVVRLSTTPCLEEGVLTPRPCIVRVFLTATSNGWEVMPGGFCRIADHGDARAISMQRGGRSADVWVLSDGPVRQTTLLPPPGSITIRRNTGSLPSRVADNQFWMGRYAERAEGVLRLTRAVVSRLAESDADNLAVSSALAGLLAEFGAVAKEPAPASLAALVAGAVLDPRLPGSARHAIAALRQAASAIRERLAPDTWQTLVALDEQMADGAASREAGQAGVDATLSAGLRMLSAYTGLAQDNMVRQSGWRFLKLGCRIERAATMCRVIATLAQENANATALDALLEIGDSQITYGQRYVLSPVREPVLDLLVLDDENPRALAFQLTRIVDHIDRLPGADAGLLLSTMQKRARKLHNMLETSEIGEVNADFLDTLRAGLLQLSDEISLTYFGRAPQFHAFNAGVPLVDAPGGQVERDWQRGPAEPAVP